VRSNNPGGLTMGMFTAYFDAAGNATDQPFVIVAGYLANTFQWRVFEGMWKNLHKDYEVNLPFHTSEFMAAMSNPERYARQANARQDYLELSTREKAAVEFFKNICIAEITVVNCAISCVVPMDLYKDVSTLLDLRKVVPPYALAARSCLAKVGEWERQFQVEEGVECIFEEGDFEQGKFTDLMLAEGAPSPIYRKKEQFAGLQAADHYAWEECSFFKKGKRGDEFPMSGRFDALLKSIPRMIIQPTQATLINLCHAKNIDPMTGVQHGKK